MSQLYGSVATQLFQWWLALRSQVGALPGRQHVKPEALKPILPYIFLADVEPGPEFRFRLHGTYLVNLLGQDFTWKRIGPETFGPRWRDLHACYARTIESANPIATQEIVENTSGYSMETEAIHIPLARDGVNVDMIIGSLERIDSRWSGSPTPPAGSAKEWTVVSSATLHEAKQ